MKKLVVNEKNWWSTTPFQMNRLAVYSYLTRYPYGILGLADCSQYLCQKRAKNGYCAKLSVKMRCRTRQELTDNYEILVLLVCGKADKHGSQASRQADRTAFPRSDVGLETARVR